MLNRTRTVVTWGPLMLILSLLALAIGAGVGTVAYVVHAQIAHQSERSALRDTQACESAAYDRATEPLLALVPRNRVTVPLLQAARAKEAIYLHDVDKNDPQCHEHPATMVSPPAQPPSVTRSLTAPARGGASGGQSDPRIIVTAGVTITEKPTASTSTVRPAPRRSKPTLPIVAPTPSPSPTPAACIPAVVVTLCSPLL